MPLTYEQQKNINAQLQSTGRSVLERTILIGADILRFVINFIKDMVKMVFGG